MKQNHFKDVLTNGEQAFEPKAWSDLSRKLDQKMPVKKGPFSSPLSKIILTSSIILAGAGIYVILNPDSNETSKLAKQTNEQIKTPSSSERSSNQNESEPNTSNTQTTSSANSENTNASDAIGHEANTSSDDIISNSGSSEILKNFIIDPKKEEIEAIFEHQVTEFILPVVEDFYCFGEKVIIHNKNKYPIALVDPYGKEFTIKAEQTNQTNVASAGKYSFSYPQYERRINGVIANTVNIPAFNVGSKSELDINYIADVDYENGLPYVQISSSDFNENAVWSTNKGQILEQAASSKLRTFNKGTYSVSLTKTDENQCKTTRTVQIELRDEKDEYNLLALNTIEPNHSDPRINHFMPPALKYRSANFKLTIIDPKDNHVVFVSTNAENAWDGIDQSTGQQVEMKKLFIWTVNITNPEPGERSDYGGTLIRL